MPVMLIANHIWDMQVVPLGLMNGARGTLIAFVYNQIGEARCSDGHDGQGFPSPLVTGDAETNEDSRQGNRNPLPDYVIVHFPSYTGPPLMTGLPRTWVPIRAEKMHNERTKRYWRKQLPLIPAWGLTIHKCQGLTCSEGTIIDFTTASKRRNVVGLPGMPFTAFTRAKLWARVAFRMLPSLNDFVSVRQTPLFKARQAFEISVDERHEQSMREMQCSPQQELDAHIEHLEAELLREEKRQPSGQEITDLTAALTLRGVQPMHESVLNAVQTHLGMANVPGINEVVKAFRGQRKTMGVEGKKRTTFKALRTTHQSRKSKLLKDLGNRHVSVAGDACRCKQTQSLPGSAEPPTKRVKHEDETNAASAMVSGLHIPEFELRRLILFDALLRGRSQEAEASDALDKATYPFRAASRFARDRPYAVCDLGILAGRRENACLWLSVIASWARCADNANHVAHDDVLQRIVGELPAVAQTAHLFLQKGLRSPNDVVGSLADQLRQHLCGRNGVMHHSVMIRRWFPAYAAHQQHHGTGVASRADYTRWLLGVAESEFADEIVLACLADYLRLWIVAIPSRTDWQISEYPNYEAREAYGIGSDRRILLGNNDMHYVWIY